MYILLHKVFTTYGLKFKIRVYIAISIIFLFGCTTVYAQQSLDTYGFVQNKANDDFKLNTLESNVGNYSINDNWDFALTLSSRMNTNSNLNIHSISIGKKISKHYLFARFTPGIKQEFVFNSRTEFLVGDTIQNYKTNLSYIEKYGFGYSYAITNDFSFGASFRYFQQNFSEEYPTFYSDSTTQIIQIRNKGVDKNFWKGDLGLNFKYNDQLYISLATNNFLIAKDFDEEDNKSEFGISRTDYNIDESKEIILNVYFSPLESVSLVTNYETDNSFIFGGNYNFNYGGFNISLGAQLFHDGNQNAILTGYQPSLNISSNLFALTLSYLGYTENQQNNRTLQFFKEYNIKNIENNAFSNNRLTVNFNAALTFKNKQVLKIIDLTILGNIFPTLKENYIDQPFAKAKIVNLTDEVVVAKAYCFIDEVNEENFYSPLVNVQPNDTVEIPFFNLIKDGYEPVEKSKIVQAKFFVKSINEEVDDFIQKPILIYNKNSWDGLVKNLRYFVNKDIDYAEKLSKKILSESNLSQKNSNKKLLPFKKAEVIFNSFIKYVNYISDRRATVDKVQFPQETIKLGGGDCDDLSVCLSALLESQGIETAFIDYKPNGGVGHVTIMFNTKLSPAESSLVTINEKKYYIRKSFSGKDEVWIPIEVTKLTNFQEAWNTASTEFYNKAVSQLGLSKSLIEIIDVY